MKNMVDERFELIAVICRLAGRPEYSSPDFGAYNTDYHKNVAETFAQFAEHEAVMYAKQIAHILHYDKAFKFAVHITKVSGVFVFIDDINSLFVTWGEETGWDEETANEFLRLYNKFYVDTNYAEFYDSHRTLFEEATEKFIEGFYKHIDFSWFGKYVDISNLRCIYSLSSGNYGATVNDTIIYSLVHGGTPPIIHEFCHSFANPLADRWYNENPEFKKWCDDSVNLQKLPFYSDGLVMAFEYVTRAYDILYGVQHGENLDERLSKERDYKYKDSFKYIKEVYDMILELEK